MEKIETLYMATSSYTPYLVFPAVLFLLLLCFFFRSPINQNLGLPVHSSSSSTLNHSLTNHQTPEASPSPSLFLRNVSTYGVPSTSTTSVVGGLIKEKMSPLERIEGGLARGRAAIREAVRSRNYTSQKEETFIPRGAVYRNPYAFH